MQLECNVYPPYVTGDEQADLEFDSGRDDSNYRYEDLQDLDPVAANRIHPNNQRKVGFQPWNSLGRRIYINRAYVICTSCFAPEIFLVSNFMMM